MKPFARKGSIKTIGSIYSVELPDTANELLGDRVWRGSRINFKKTFMQFMCPSCCGGLFSEPKGSVYTKRNATKNDTIKSETTTIGSDDGAEKPRTGVFSSSVDAQRQMASDNLIKEEMSESNERVKGAASNKNVEFYYETIDENIVAEEHVIRTEPSSASGRSETKEHEKKLVRGKTVREEIHMYSKELTEKVNHEQGNTSENGEAKWSNILRKTSFPNNEAVPDDTVVELKIAGKDHVEVRKQNGASEAPFDFQAFLRKTNTTRQSLRRCSDISERFPDKTFVIAELLPNVVLEGTVYNL